MLLNVKMSRGFRPPPMVVIVIALVPMTTDWIFAAWGPPTVTGEVVFGIK